MPEEREMYKDLSAEDIFKILKQKIESLKDFEVEFEDSVADLSIHLDYDCKKNTYELNVAKFVNFKIAESKYGTINVPDDRIVGTGHVYSVEGGRKIVSIGESGTLITIARHSRALFFTSIRLRRR